MVIVLPGTKTVVFMFMYVLRVFILTVSQKSKAGKLGGHRGTNLCSKVTLEECLPRLELKTCIAVVAVCDVFLSLPTQTRARQLEAQESASRAAYVAVGGSTGQKVDNH